MECGRLLFRGHAIRRMQERQIGFQDVVTVAQNGEPILEWIDGHESSRLMLGFPGGRPLRVVLALRPPGSCLVVSVHEPDPGEWTPDFKRKVRR